MNKRRIKKFCIRCGEECKVRIRHSRFSEKSGAKMSSFIYYCPKRFFEDLPIGGMGHTRDITGYYFDHEVTL